MIPHYFLTVDDIPLTPNGKVDRARLQTPVESESAVGHHEAPADSAEIAIAEIWTNLIQPVRAIGRHDKFFEMGGHSLLAMRALQQITSTLGVKLDFHILLEESVAEIASRCQQTEKNLTEVKHA